jgi:Transposase IS66 family
MDVLATLDLDLDQITDEPTRRMFQVLLNLVEEQHAELVSLRAELQQVRDENARLKGGSGRPTVRPQATKTPPADHSSERERHTPTPRRPRGKRAGLTIHRVEQLAVDPELLPPDAVFKGYVPVIVQDLLIQPRTTCFRKEKWYSPSTRQTYVAELPPGYHGQFGPGVKAVAVALSYAGEMSEPKLLGFLRSVGVDVSAGTLAGWLIHEVAPFHAEAGAVTEAGLASGPWHHLDDTATRVDGQNQHCFVLANPLYTRYRTLPGKDRLTVVDVLRDGRPRAFLLDATAQTRLDALTVSARTRQALAGFPRDTVLDEATLEGWLGEHLPVLGKQAGKAIRETLAVAAYQASRDGPVVQLLVGDDAGQWAKVTPDGRALCWIHAGRHFKQLSPCVPRHQTLLARFLARFWRYYRALLAYRECPSAAKARRLERRFDVLFATETGYHGLDARIAATRANKAELLVVLAHPEAPLHNNPAELGARQRVRKRDISFGPRGEAGMNAWDTFQTLVATANKLGVSFYHYVRDRITMDYQLPSLADLITARAPALNLGASWAAT